MISSTKASFRKRFNALPREAQALAIKTYRLWRRDPWHHSLHFKKVGRYWSARVDYNIRALAVRQGEQVSWFWIGPHDEYERLIRQG